MTKTTLHLPADAAGPRGISTEKHGDVLLQPGEVREDLTLSDEELERAESNEIVKGKPKAKADEPDTDAERAARATGHGGADPKTEKGGEANAQPKDAS